MVLSYEPILSGQRHPRLRSGTKVQEEVRLILLNPSPFLSGRRPAPAALAFFLSLPATLVKNRRFLGHGLTNLVIWF